MKKILIAILVITVLAVAGFAMAQGWGRGQMGQGPMGPGYGPGPQNPGSCLTALNITPEQKQKMQTAQESFVKETIPLRNELQSKQLELRNLWGQNDPDSGKIIAKQKEVNVLRDQLQEKAIKNRLEMRAMLTPEQQTKLGTCPEGLGHGRKGHGMWGGRGDGPGMGKGFKNCPRW
jgi:Spy/CpxP family protein refolding chaperone